MCVFIILNHVVNEVSHPDILVLKVLTSDYITGWSHTLQKEAALT